MIQRQSQLLGRALRQPPAGLDRLTGAAVRGGYLRVGADGLLWLPLGARVRDRIRSKLRSAIASDWPVALVDGTNCSAVFSILGGEIHSYRDLPFRLGLRFHRPPANRLLKIDFAGEVGALSAAADEPSARAALAPSEARLEEVMRSMGLHPFRAAAGPGGAVWAEPGDAGSASILRCERCGYAALAEWAEFSRGEVGSGGAPLALVETPGATTIGRLCEQLGIVAAGTVKAMLFSTDGGEVILVLLRGDLELSPSKLQQCLGGVGLRTATEGEIRSAGMVPGYAGPIGLKVRTADGTDGLRVLADASIMPGIGHVGGANRDGTHYTGATLGRDYEVTIQADLALARRGAPCAQCGAGLEAMTGVVVGRRQLVSGGFALTGDAGAEAEGAYGVLETDTVSVFAAVLNAAGRESGLAWPAACAPYDVHVVSLTGGEGIDALLSGLEARGLDVLFDDRDASAGSKFADADWVGCPVRLTAGRKSAERGGVEVRTGSGAGEVLPIPEAIEVAARSVRPLRDGEVM